MARETEASVERTAQERAAARRARVHEERRRSSQAKVKRRRAEESAGARAIKDRRIEMRADVQSEDRIVRAAALEKSSVSAFVLAAALRRADEVLARADVTLMPAEQFDALMASLDVPDEAPALAAIAARPRRFTRR